MSDASLALAVQGVVSFPGSLDAVAEWDCVERARAGDLRAFDALMLQYESRLLRFLIGLVGDGMLAQELCQDTFLAAFEALPRTQGEVRVSAWLHTIALNRARSYHRRRKLRSFLPFDPERHAGTVSDSQDGFALQDSVRAVLARMPERYSQPLLLQVVSGMSCREIGEVLGCSEGAVKIRLLRAREAFRLLYSAEEADR